LTHVTTEIPPTPIPDGAWTQVRIELVRMRLSARGQDRLPAEWSTVPGATVADFAYASSQFATAATHYRAQLAVDPDRPTALIGLGLALSTYGPEPAARALLRCPELVRAVHRGLRSTARHVPTPEQVASWIGCLVAD
jgi:hypothetical protein